jgi:choline dehydrogenase
MANIAGDAFDYVIVGSGAAGSVLAHRLTEEPDATVCVLEAGPPDRHPYIHVPAGFIKILFNPDFTSHQPRGDLADALWRDMVRRITGEDQP